MLLGNRKIELNGPTYFIADIGANHDGQIERAKELIRMCAEAGADAVKFQHFKAKNIVSDIGFRALIKNICHTSPVGQRASLMFTRKHQLTLLGMKNSKRCVISITLTT